MRFLQGLTRLALATVFVFCAGAAQAAEAHGLPGGAMSLFWVIPFAGLLLSIATGPVLYPHVWEHHYGKITFMWAALTVVPMAIAFGPSLALESSLHAVLLEYMSFIILLFALFTIAGGVLITGNINGTPATNTLLLVIGAVMASFVGTTGASMIMIRPLIRANDNRPFNAHVVIFFIFLVANIGGSLTPLGDPPLFVGFLRGVDFFWTTVHIFPDTLFVGGIVLVIFVILDTILHRREKGLPKIKDPTPDTKVGIRGLRNIPLLLGVICAILLSAYWKPGVTYTVYGVPLELENIVRDVLILGLALASLVLTPKRYREANDFNWGPIAEVAKLFAGIFICIVPVVAILRAGLDGALGPLVSLVTLPSGDPNDFAYFWLTGLLSSFLDNAPTYLVFFEMAGGDPQHLMTTFARTLAAISAGAVFMGANTYIGNAPNFMIYAIARERGVAMPSFFGYMLWSGIILLPIFVVSSYLFFG